MKLDMSKTYNKVEWPFLLRIVQKMGFNDRWLLMIEKCISFMSYSILLNGYPSDPFKPERGLR